MMAINGALGGMPPEGGPPMAQEPPMDEAPPENEDPIAGVVAHIQEVLPMVPPEKQTSLMEAMKILQSGGDMEPMGEVSAEGMEGEVPAF
jgi:hypothetical protein